MHQDKTLNCQDCGKDFIFTASEQDFYAEKEFTNEPKRCSDCRRLKKNNFRDMQSNRAPVEIQCGTCGKTDTVSFKPKGDRPVLCGDCFRKQREQNSPHARTEGTHMRPGESVIIEEKSA